MKHVVVVLSAVLFAVGLGIGGMLQPARIVGFLDFFGRWDPTLAFVMVGALGVNIVSFRLSSARKKPVLDAQFYLPSQIGITPALVGGSALFGVGWALAGYCPGPALTSLGAGVTSCVALVGAMAVGSVTAAKFLGWLQQPAASGRRTAASPALKSDG